MYDFIWISVHFLVALSELNRKLKIILSFFVSISYFCFYFLVPTNGDRQGYLNYLNNLDSSYGVFEPGFWVSSKFISFMGLPADTIIFLYGIFMLLFLVLAVLNLNRVFKIADHINLFYLSVIVFSSVFYFLGAQNVLRQGLSLSILVLGLSYILRSRIFLGFIICALSMLFHVSSFIFVVTFYYVYKAAKTGPIAGFVLMLIYSGVVLFLIYYIYSGSAYLDNSHEWSGDRTSNAIKFVAISIYFSFSYILINSVSSLDILNRMRFFVFIFVSFFVFSGELYARLLMGFYLVDLIVILLACHLRNTSIQFAVMLTVMSSALAPNILGLIV
jgi:hypothetical protein